MPSQANSARLPRHDLMRLLDRSTQYALTLIIAPAGSGKSTLLSQWAGQAPRRQARLSLTRRDADPLFFLQRLNTALHEAIPGFVMLSCNALNTGPEEADTLAASLADSLAAVTDDFYLLIDDFHFATSPLVQGIFAGLLANLPDTTHLILSSRHHPGFSLSRLKLEDRLLMLDGHDLRLAAEQLPDLCASLEMTPLTAEESRELMALTEGWLAGIRLALMARARTGHFMPRDFHGGQPELVDYFANVVLAELPPEERGFLLATAVFERFDAALCNALPGVSEAHVMLERLQRKGLFLQAVEEMPGWYRYHPLLQHVLQDRLCQETPERMAELHLGAARHFMNTGDEESALFHGLRSGREEDALDLLRAACDRWIRQGKFIPVLNALDSSDPERLRSDPGLFLPKLSALIFSRQFEKARMCLEDICYCNQCEGCPDHIPELLRYMERVLALFQDDTALILDAEAFRNGELPTLDTRDSSLALSARYHLLNGECEDAIRLARQARLLLDQINHEYLVCFADVIQILAERELGHILAARQMTQDLWDRHGAQPKTPCWVNAGTCMAVSLYEQNRVPEARELCDALIQQVDSACSTEIVFNVYVTLARLQYIAGHHARGVQLLLQLRRILRQGRYRRLLNQLLAEELAHALRSGQAATIKGIAEEYDLAALLASEDWEAPPRQFREARVYGGIAIALYLRSRRQFDRAQTVLQALESMLSRTEMRTRRLVVEANRIVILYLRGEETAALQALAELFARVGLQCAIRTVFDEAPGFGGLVRLAHEKALIALPEIYLQLYANVLYPPVTEVAGSGPEPLTAKEQEVLELVRQGLANKEISRELNISLSTTKWHLKNIFAKLQVSNRTSAMAVLARSESGHRKTG